MKLDLGKTPGGNLRGSLIGCVKECKQQDFRTVSDYLQYYVKIGTNVTLSSDNAKVEPHRGEYYLLFVSEFRLVYLFYVDVKSKLRFVYIGEDKRAAEAIYNNVANDTTIKILKSSGNKKAYRVKRIDVLDNMYSIDIVPLKYKNKSSKQLETVYLSLFDAINLAANLESERQKRGSSCKTCFQVVTPKNTILFTVGDKVWE